MLHTPYAHPDRKGDGVAWEAIRPDVESDEGHDEGQGAGPATVGGDDRVRSAERVLHAVPVVPMDPAPTAEPLPDPEETARALALCVVEILSGAREVDSIARWVTDDVHRHLQQRAALTARNRSGLRRAVRRPSLRAGSVVACSPADGIVEATVVVHGRSHARAVAIRLETRNGRWRATAVGVL